MASKTIKLRAPGREIDASLQPKIGKEDLYGRIEHRVEHNGVALERGWLLPEGVIIHKSRVAMTGVDPEGSPVETPLVFCAGNRLELRASSFEIGETLEPAPLDILARFLAVDVYPLEASGLATGVYRTAFNYRKSARSRDAVVVVRDDGAFLLVGQLKACPMVARSVAYEFFDASDRAGEELSDPLDFNML